MSTPSKRGPFAYLVTLPERIVRSAAALAGGAVYQATELLIPGWLRKSKFYQATIARMLRITVELVGGVRGAMPADLVSVQDLAVRKAAGNVVEFGAILAVGWSPLWMLAAASDITGGTRLYLRTLADDLKKEGLLPSDADVTTFDELLDRFERTAGVLADTIDVPPSSVEQIRKSWDRLRGDPSDVPTPERQEELFRELEQVSRTEGMSPLEVSTLVAASVLRTGVQMGNRYILQYYQEALEAIVTEGLATWVTRISRPYRGAVRRHLNPRSPTYTERAFHWVRGKLGGAGDVG